MGNRDLLDELVQIEESGSGQDGGQIGDQFVGDSHDVLVLISLAALPYQVDSRLRQGLGVLCKDVEDALGSLDQFLVSIFFEDELNDLVGQDPLGEGLHGQQLGSAIDHGHVRHLALSFHQFLLDHLELLHSFYSLLEVRAHQESLGYL